MARTTRGCTVDGIRFESLLEAGLFIGVPSPHMAAYASKKYCKTIRGCRVEFDPPQSVQKVQRLCTGMAPHNIPRPSFDREAAYQALREINVSVEIADAAAPMIAALPWRKQVALMLWLEGYTQNEIGAFVGRSQPWVSRICGTGSVI